MIQSHTWLDAVCALSAEQLPAILITLASARGSTPRAAGAKMLVLDDTGPHSVIDTVGGGHMEMRAIEEAQAMLAQQKQHSETLAPRLHRYALGPSLGQCCGGSVQLIWEVVDAQLQQVFQHIRTRLRARADSWRLVALPLPLPLPLPSSLLSIPATQIKEGQSGAELLSGSEVEVEVEVEVDEEDKDEQNYDASGEPVPFPLHGTQHVQDAVGRNLLSLGGSGIVAPNFSHGHGCHVIRTNEAIWLVEPTTPLQAHLYLFGAGHVGRAVVMALASLPCHVTWIDERAEMFPQTAPKNARVEITDNPFSLLALAKPGACFLVMTHSHQLDMQLTEAILRLPHLGWFGLIGSETKRQLFVNRLEQRGLSEAQIEQMVCPVGIAGIKAKQPEVIAASIAAQLLQVWQKRELLPD